MYSSNYLNDVFGRPHDGKKTVGSIKLYEIHRFYIRSIAKNLSY